jgi:predicted nucleic acid-binding protein
VSCFILLDNTVLSNFAHARRSSTVFSLWGNQVCTTMEIIKEYNAGILSAGLPKSAWRGLKVIEQTEEEKSFGANLSTGLGAGERSCLAVAHARGAIFATDDLFARETAKKHKVPVIGTVGILMECIRTNILTPTRAQNALNVMITNGYRSPVESIGDL